VDASVWANAVARTLRRSRSLPVDRRTPVYRPEMMKGEAARPEPPAFPRGRLRKSRTTADRPGRTSALKAVGLAERPVSVSSDAPGRVAHPQSSQPLIARWSCGARDRRRFTPKGRAPGEALAAREPVRATTSWSAGLCGSHVHADALIDRRRLACVGAVCLD
jgi:hypothetical protein